MGQLHIFLLHCEIQEGGAVSIWNILIVIAQGENLMNYELTLLPKMTHITLPAFHWPNQVTWLNMILMAVEK